MDEPERKLNPPPPVSTPVEAPWTDVSTIIAELKDLSTNIQNLVDVLTAGGGVPGAPGAPGAPGLPWPLSALVPLLQRDEWAHDHVLVPTPGDAVQMPVVEIPPGFDLVVRALPDNTDDVYVGNSKANASNAVKRIELSAGEVVKLRISNTSLIYVDAVVADEGIEFYVEV